MDRRGQLTNQGTGMKSFIRHNAGLALCALVLVAGCAPDVPLQMQNTSTPNADVFPDASYLLAEKQGKNILRIDAQKSMVVFEVRRAGAFARFGHDHVVASHDVKGYVAPDDNRADLLVRLDQLVIDEPDLRAQAGFTTRPSADDIAGTRHNMLSKVLDADRFPDAVMRIARKDDGSMLSVTITLHGTTRTFDVPAKIEMQPGSMIVSGEMHFNQTDFGITPLSILNGAIQVADRLDMHFHIVARRAG
jgi:hypothetical protein